MCKRLPPTAVFVQSDETAVEVMNGVCRLGLTVPGDLSIAGVNDSSIAPLVRVPLTTLSLPTAEIGAWMAESVVSRVEGDSVAGETRYFPCRVVSRDSVASVEQA